MRIRILAAFAALMLWASAAFGQTTSETWPTENTPCEQVLHPPLPVDMTRVRALIAEGQAALPGLSDTATDASSLATRDRIRAIFQEAHQRSGGSLDVVYSHGQVLRRVQQREIALHVLECLRMAPGFAALLSAYRDGTTNSIIALRRDIEASHPVVVTPPVHPPIIPPGQHVVVAPRVGPVVPPVNLRPTPHPRSVPMRTAGQIITGVGAATLLTGAVLTVLCAIDVNGDVAYLNEANMGNPHGWSEGRADRQRTLCAAGPALLGAGAGVAAGGAALWYVGSRPVTEVPRGTNGIPIISFAPTRDGTQASATWRF